MTSLPAIDRYAVEAELGSGAFGAVYRARHLVLDRKVALKVLHPQRASDADVVQRFLREARAVAGLGSAHVAQILDAGTTSDGRAFLAMELLEGEDLAQRLQRKGRLPAHQAIRVGREILAALAVAHAQGIVHRDLKPGNVFVARTASGDETAKVLDFGISKVRSESPVDELTRTGTMLGTPHYMAPEQFKSSRDVDGRADLYSLGVLLYETLTGRLPFAGSSLHELIAAKLTEAPPPFAQVAPDVPRAIGDVVMRALATEPGDRYASAAEMDAALASVEATVSAPGVSLRPSGPTSVRPAPMPTAGPSSVRPAAPSRSARIVPWIVGLGTVTAAGVFLALAVTLVGLFFARRELDAWLSGSSAAPPSAPAAAPPAPVARPRAPAPTYVPAPTYAPAPAAPAPAAPAPMPAPTASSGTSARDGVRVIAASVGLVDASALEAVADRALPGLAACRGPSAYHETIELPVMLGGRLLAPSTTSTGPTHDCVAAALVAAGPVDTVASGIARYDVTLDPR